jgi:hypothetical protein
MIAVAGVALILGGIVVPIRLHGMRQRYRSLATLHALQEETWHLAGDGSTPDVLEMIDYHAWLKAKYARAATRPWLSVEPDPPPPLLPPPDLPNSLPRLAP